MENEVSDIALISSSQNDHVCPGCPRRDVLNEQRVLLDTFETGILGIDHRLAILVFGEIIDRSRSADIRLAVRRNNLDDLDGLTWMWKG